MERIGRENNIEDKERVRDRTRPRRKKRFDDGPDPEQIKQGVIPQRARDYQNSNPEMTEVKPATVVRKTTTYVGNDKHAKRAYIGNIPQDTDHSDLQ